jgi:hypothetical protein
LDKIWVITDHSVYGYVNDDLYFIVGESVTNLGNNKVDVILKDWIGFPANKYEEINAAHTFNIGKTVVEIIPFRLLVPGYKIVVNSETLLFTSSADYLLDTNRLYIRTPYEIKMIDEECVYASKYLYADDNVLIESNGPNFIIQFKEYTYTAKHFLVGPKYIYFGTDELYRIPRINELKFVDIPIEDI